MNLFIRHPFVNLSNLVCANCNSFSRWYVFMYVWRLHISPWLFTYQDSIKPIRYDVCYKYVGVGTGFWVVPLFANWFTILLLEI